MEILLSAGSGGVVEAIAGAKAQKHTKIEKLLKAALKKAAEADAAQEKAQAYAAAEFDAKESVETLMRDVDAESDEILRSVRVNREL